LACQALFLQVPEHHFGTRPRDGTDTAFPHHPHATLWSGRRWDVVGSDVFFGSLCIARSPSSSTALHHHNDMSAPQCRRCVELEGRNCREGASCGRGKAMGESRRSGCAERGRRWERGTRAAVWVSRTGCVMGFGEVGAAARRPGLARPPARPELHTLRGRCFVTRSESDRDA